MQADEIGADDDDFVRSLPIDKSDRTLRCVVWFSGRKDNAGWPCRQVMPATVTCFECDAQHDTCRPTIAASVREFVAAERADWGAADIGMWMCADCE